MSKALFILIFGLSYSLCENAETSNNFGTTTQRASGSSDPLKLWVYFDLTQSLAAQVERRAKSDLKLKCEAVFNVTKAVKHDEEIVVPPYILENLLRNVDVQWFKNDNQLKESNRVVIKKVINKAHLTTMLRVRNLSKKDEGNYTCTIKNAKSEKRSQTKLSVKDYEVKIDKIEMPGDLLENSPSQVQVIGSDGRKQMQSTSKTIEDVTVHPLCQPYNGSICAKFLQGHHIYVGYNTTIDMLEARLVVAFKVVNYSNDISYNCEGFAWPSLCFSTFPICRTPHETNEYYVQYAKAVITAKAILDQHSSNSSASVYKLDIQNDPIEKILNYRYNNSVVRRVCKHDCEIIENELCQKEYAIAKRHQLIGKQLDLEECFDLPDNDPECLKVGMLATMVSDDDCYWENGDHYIGKVNVSEDGDQCILWHEQLYTKLSDFRELSGLHSYCRNPGGMEHQPWCYIRKDGMPVKAFCNIPKCARKIWIYIIAVFSVIILIFGSLTISVCCKKHRENNANIRSINLPNADKNIYGNSRINSPLETIDLLSGQNGINGEPNNSRRNGILRVPHYTLSQIKFLEELGEGAFGKVYKGALAKGSDTMYVAVKALKENASVKTKADFRREIELISELRHDNIVCIVGVALQEEPLCMLFEFMARGDLHEFLMGRAPPAGKGLPAQRLLSIAHHISCGMQYLASHHYVHRDLAARNCLVSDDFVVKISDFGLSRDIYSSDYYRVQSKSLLPVRWMPPESILYGKFTTDSDIWSYGVVLWEIYSYGLQPYYGYSNQEVIGMVRGGDLLACPSGCPPAIYGLMKECWRHTPQKRPNFDVIAARLQTWVQTGICTEPSPTEAPSNSTLNRQTIAMGEMRERMPLMQTNGPHRTTGSLRKPAKPSEDTRSTCSEIPPHVSRKKGSCVSLDAERLGARETVVVRMRTGSQGNDI